MPMRDEERASERVWIDRSPDQTTTYQPPAPAPKPAPKPDSFMPRTRAVMRHSAGVTSKAIDEGRPLRAAGNVALSALAMVPTAVADVIMPGGSPRTHKVMSQNADRISQSVNEGQYLRAAGQTARGALRMLPALTYDALEPPVSAVGGGIADFGRGLLGGAPPADLSATRPLGPGAAAPGTRSATDMMGPALGRDTSVPGIMRRDVGGVPEFYNQQNGRTPAPLGAGTVNSMPASAITGGGDLNLAVLQAEKAAMARGDHPDQIAGMRAAARARGPGAQPQSQNFAKANKLLEQARSLSEQSAGYRDPRMRARLNRQVKQLESQAEQYTTAGRAELEQSGAMQRTAMGEEGSDRRAMLSAQTQMSDPTGQGAYNQARTKQTEATTRQLESGGPLEPPQFNDKYHTALLADPSPAAQAEAASMLRDFKVKEAAYAVRSMAAQTGSSITDWAQAYREGRIPKDSNLYIQMELLYGPREDATEDAPVPGAKKLAEGGLVEMDEGYGDMPSMEGDMGPYSGAMDLMGGSGAPMDGAGGMGMPGQMDPAMQAYAGYAEGARKLGLPVIPYEQFLALQQSAGQGMPGAGGAGPAEPYSAMGFAAGGLVPGSNDVSNKMVVDTNPGAATDSIPAMIDGQQPAALDSGEMVISADVVRYLGVEKINKLIAQAKQGMTNGADAGTNRPDGAALGAAQ